jgi:hypothetical protein
MELPDCVREESWLIVALTRSNDETSEQADTGERGEDGPGYSQDFRKLRVNDLALRSNSFVSLLTGEPL